MLVLNPLAQKTQEWNLMFPCYQYGADGEPHAAVGGYFLLLLTWQYEGRLSGFCLLPMHPFTFISGVFTE